MTDKNDDVLAVLVAHEFDHKGYCLSCGGWMVSDNGCTPHAHEQGCAFVKAKTAISELLAADEEYDAAKFELAAARQQRFHVGLSRATGDAETDAFHRDLDACSRVKLAIMRRDAAIRACGGGK